MGIEVELGMIQKKEEQRFKVLQPTDWSFEPMDKYNSSGGDAFSVSRFGYEYLRDYNIDVDFYVPDYSKTYAKLLKKILKLEGCNLILQIALIKKSKSYDVIYYSADRHPYLLALARRFRICHAPILMVSHFSYDTRAVESREKKHILKLERKVVFKSIDQVVFNCETLLKLACEDYNIPYKDRVNSGWGADLDYFARGKYGIHDDIKPYYFAAGGANRDYHTIIEAFRKLPYRLVLSCPKSVIDEEKSLPENIIYFDYAKYGVSASEYLREFYHDAKAVLIPIMSRNHVANGASVFVEALACGKPILISDLPTNFLDVEEEQIGYKVALHDINGWIGAIQHMEQLSMPELDTMGTNAKKIAEMRYNYKHFTEIVAKYIKDLAGRKRKSNENINL